MGENSGWLGGAWAVRVRQMYTISNKKVRPTTPPPPDGKARRVGKANAIKRILLSEPTKTGDTFAVPIISSFI